MAAAQTNLASKLDVLSAQASAAATPRALQLAVLAAHAPGTAEWSAAAQLAVLSAVAPPASKLASTTQLQVLIARSGGEANVTARASQAAMLIAYGTGVPNSTRSDSWTFVMDGHRFWVLPLGPEGDWAYDTVTKQWCQLNTQGFPGLNFTHGIMWKLRVMGGDLLYPFLYELDPDQPDDEGWRPVEHIVTGGLSTRAPDMIGVANFRCAASVGKLSDATTDVNLTFSDDNGQSWVGPFTITLEEGTTNQPLVWSALGAFAAPGRIFKITDQGGMLSIYGGDAALNNYDEDDNQSTGGGGNGG